MINTAEADWQMILSDILMHLTSELASTNMKNKVIANLTLHRANKIVESFDEDQLEEWKVGMQDAVKGNDWTNLIEHRTYFSDYQIIRSHLIATTAELRIQNIAPPVSSPEQEKGTPIEIISPVHY